MMSEKMSAGWKGGERVERGTVSSSGVVAGFQKMPCGV